MSFRNFTLLANLIGMLFYPSISYADREDRLFIELPEENFAQDAPHNNWFRSDADFWRGAAQGMLEPLFVWDEESQQLRGWLARRYAFSPDEESIAIWIRPEARWSDGRRLTAHDVAFSIELARTQTGLDGPHVAAIRESIESVKSPNRFRVEIELKSANRDFLKRHFTPLEGLSFPIVPKRDWENVSDVVAFENPDPVGSGPYTADGRDAQTDGMAWSRNSNWWGRRAKLEALPAPARLFFVPPPDTSERRVRGITNGRLDAALPVSAGACDGMKRVVTFSDAWPMTVDMATVHLPYSRLYWDGWPENAPENWPETQQAQILIHDLSPSELNPEK